MKRSFILISITALILFSCKKDTSGIIPNSLDGTWKMILVKDNATNTSATKPASLSGDVIITFVSNSSSSGVFNGNTPSNDVGPNTYTLGPSHAISIPVMSMTKVGETSWGMYFVANIRDAQQYNFAAGEILNIVTINKTLRFKKI